MDGTLELDRFGRVLPKKLQAALRLQPGGRLHSRLDGEHLAVRPEPQRATVRSENGFPIIEFAGEVSFSGEPVTEARAERERELPQRLAETW